MVENNGSWQPMNVMHPKGRALRRWSDKVSSCAGAQQIVASLERARGGGGFGRPPSSSGLNMAGYDELSSNCDDAGGGGS